MHFQASSPHTFCLILTNGPRITLQVSMQQPLNEVDYVAFVPILSNTVLTMGTIVLISIYPKAAKNTPNYFPS